MEQLTAGVLPGGLENETDACAAPLHLDALTHDSGFDAATEYSEVGAPTSQFYEGKPLSTTPLRPPLSNSQHLLWEDYPLDDTRDASQGDLSHMFGQEYLAHDQNMYPEFGSYGGSYQAEAYTALQGDQQEQYADANFVADAEPDWNGLMDGVGSQSQAQDEEMEDDDASDPDQSMLEDARKAYRNDKPLEMTLLPTPPASSDADLAMEPSDSVDIAKTVRESLYLTQERWSVDMESAAFLASVMSLANQPKKQGTLDPWQVLKGLRMEEPALRSDPQIDMIRLYERNTVHLSADGIKPYVLNVDKDESIDWSKKHLELPAKIDSAIAEEKLHVEEETLNYLKEICLGPKFSLEEWSAREIARNAPITRVSSPLLPLSPPYSPSRLSSPAAEFDLTSTPEDPSVRQIAELEEDLFEQDDLAMQNGPTSLTSSNSLDSPNKSNAAGAQGPNSSSPLKRKTTGRRSLKVSSPLLPVDHEPPVKKAKTVTFMDELEEHIPVPMSDDYSAVDDPMETIADILRPHAQHVIDRANHEELSEVDTVLRVPVTALADGDVARASVLEHNKQSHKLLTNVVQTIPRDERKWNLASNVEEGLGWSPFPTHLGRIKPERPFDDGSLARYMADLKLEGEFDLKTLTWKPDGLRLFDVDEDEDDEISAAEYDDNEEEDDQDTVLVNDHQAPVAPTQPPRRRRRDTDDHKPSQHDPTVQKKASCQEVQGPSDLDYLLQKRKIALGQEQTGHHRQSAADMPKHQRKADSTAGDQQLTKSGIFGFGDHQNWPVTNPPPAVQPAALPPQPQPQPIEHPTPLPTFTPPAHPIPAIISPSLLSNRTLIRSLQLHLPTLDLIERPSSPSLADLTLSPSTGILLTTLQNIKQRPLPGQTSSTTTITSRLQHLSTAYPNLILLITGPGTLDSSDTLALNTLPPNTTSIYIPSPSPTPSSLPLYLAATITRHITPLDPLISLLPSPTTWELFLTQICSLNPFAAQAILSEIKGNLPGLAGLVQMSPQERIERFAGLLGGEEVIWRVSEVLDAGWSSAANAR